MNFISVCIMYLFCLSNADFSTHPQISSITKQNQNYSSSVRVHWYFPEYGYGDYADTTVLYSCRYTDNPYSFIFGYKQVLISKPKYGKINYSAKIDNMPKGNLCFQVCALFDDSHEKCSKAFKFENKLSVDSQPESYPVFWNQDKSSKLYPRVLEVRVSERDLNITWYFPRYQFDVYKNTRVYTGTFNPEDLAISNTKMVKEFVTKEQNIHNVIIPKLRNRWTHVMICVSSHYSLCGPAAKFDSNILYYPPDKFTKRPVEQVVSKPPNHLPMEEVISDRIVDKDKDYEVLFDDYENYDSLFKERETSMISPVSDKSFNSTTNEKSSSNLILPNNYVELLLIFLMYCTTLY